MKEIVIATRNPGKLEEFKVLMKDLEVELRSLEEWPNVPEPEETGKTFMANARLKAVYYARFVSEPLPVWVKVKCALVPSEPS